MGWRPGISTMGIVISTDRKPDDKARAHSFVTALLYRNGPAMSLDQALHNVQPDSSACFFPPTGIAFIRQANEALENPLAVFDRHAGAFVSDGQKCL